MPFRHAITTLIRRPAYTLLAVTAMALGVAGTTAVYSLVHHVLVEGLPFEDPDRLVTPDVRSPQGYVISLSIPNYQDWTQRSRVFDRYGASSGWTVARPLEDGGAEILSARAVLGDFFATLGLEAAAGRLITAPETEPGSAPLAVLSHGFWQRAYGGEDVIGESIVTDEFSATIVGILPPGAGYPSQNVELYFNMGALSESLPWSDRDSSFGTRMLGRLAPGLTFDAAQADLSRVAREVAAEEGAPVATPELRPLDDLFLGEVRGGLWLLMAAVGLLLLIATANVANLSLARGEARGRELAVRAALGADRGSLVGVLLAESIVIAAAAGALGVALSAAAIRVLPDLLPLDLPSLTADRISLDAPVVAFALSVTALSGLVFGLLPALRLAGSDSARGVSALAALRHGNRLAGGRKARRLRDGLVVTQVALSLVLLVAAGLLTRSLSRLGQVDKGFVAENVVTAEIQLPDGAFPEPERRWAFYDELKARLEAASEVESVAMTLLVPLAGGSWERLIAPEGGSLERVDMESVLYNVVGDDYFGTLGIPLRRGRALGPADRADGAPVVIIDETMAERFWPGEDPLGQRVAFETPQPGDPPVWLTVVGVVANVRHYELESPSRIQAWVPMRQVSRGINLDVVMQVRAGAEAAGIGLLRGAVADLAPGAAVSDVRPLSDIVDDRLGPARWLGTLTALFATFALLLAALGIFGVLSLAVARRRRELGVRLAIGATPAAVVQLVAGYALLLAGSGVAIGLAAALAAGRVMDSFLFEIGSFDPLVYGTVTAAMLLLALAASAAPALRAAATDPARVLREE